MIKFVFKNVRVLYLQHTPKIAHTATVHILCIPLHIKGYRAKYDSYCLRGPDMPTPQLVRTSLGVERVENIENPANIYSIRAAAVSHGLHELKQPLRKKYST